MGEAGRRAVLTSRSCHESWTSAGVWGVLGEVCFDEKREKRLMMGGLGGGCCFGWAATIRSGNEEDMSPTGSSFSFVGEGRRVKVKGSDSPVNQSESLLVERVGRVFGRSGGTKGGSWIGDGEMYGGGWLSAGG